MMAGRVMSAGSPNPAPLHGSKLTENNGLLDEASICNGINESASTFISDEDTHPLAIKLHGLLKTDMPLRTMREKSRMEVAGTKGAVVWLRARAERLRKVVSDVVPNGISKLRSISVNRTDEDSSFGIHVATSANGGLVVVHVASNSLVAGLIQAGDHILVLNQRLGIDCSLDNVNEIISSTSKLSLTVVRFTEDDGSRPQRTRLGTEPKPPKDWRKSKMYEMLLVKASGEPCGLSVKIAQSGNKRIVVINNVIPGGVAFRGGIKENDIIRTVNGSEAATMTGEQLTFLLQDTTIELAIERNPVLISQLTVESCSSKDKGAGTSMSESGQLSTTGSESGSDSATSPQVQRRNNARQPPQMLPRQNTVYLNNFAIPKSMPLLARRRATASGVPSSFTVPSMTKEQAKLALTGCRDGAYLFREARNVVVLSFAYKGDVKHFTLKMSLSSPFKDIDRALRKFVKYYSNKRGGKSGLPCTLSEYVMDAPALYESPGLNEALQSETGSDSDNDDGSACKDESNDDVTNGLIKRKITARRNHANSQEDDMHRELVDADGLPVSAGSSRLQSPASSSDSVVTARLPEDRNDDKLPVAGAETSTSTVDADHVMKDSAVPSVATDSCSANEKPSGPRRRKLVRGGNKKETPVLPAFQDALDALDDLDSFLNVYEQMHKDYESLDGTTSDSLPTKSYFSFKSLARNRQGFASLTTGPLAADHSNSMDRSSPSQGYIPSAHTAKQAVPYSQMMDTLF